MAVQSGVYRGVSAEDRAADRRRRLLEATLEVWSRPDSAVTMTAICAEAGLTERYFYESFPALDDALVAVMDQIAGEIEDCTRSATEAAAADPASRARAMVAAFVGLLVEDPRKGRVAIVESAGRPGLRRRRTTLLRHFAHRTAEETAGLIGLPARSTHEAEVAGLLYVGGLAELVTAWLDGAVDASPEELVDTATRMFLGLYA